MDERAYGGEWRTSEADSTEVLSEQASYSDLMVANPIHGLGGHVDLATSLAWHGVNATAVHIVSKAMDIGVVQLSRVSDNCADTLVFGANGDARWLEHMLEGVTAYILAHMITPVFMTY